MSKGRTLSYWEEAIPEGAKQRALFARDNENSQWLLVGIYSVQKAKDIIDTSYAHWPGNCVHVVSLP